MGTSRHESYGNDITPPSCSVAKVLPPRVSGKPLSIDHFNSCKKLSQTYQLVNLMEIFKTANTQKTLFSFAKGWNFIVTCFWEASGFGNLTRYFNPIWQIWKYIREEIPWIIENLAEVGCLTGNSSVSKVFNRQYLSLKSF